MSAYPLMLTVELEEGGWPEEYSQPEYGFAVIRLNGREVSRIRLKRHVYPGDRETLEQYAAGWLAGLGQEEQAGEGTA